jgi:parallel beta-helix repeat protein
MPSRTLGRTISLGLALGAGLALAGVRPAAANTLCVNAGGTGGCFSTIAAAIAAAATSGDTVSVQAGTYNEDVVIGKSVSLVGAGAATTIINALGKSNGVYVDGIDTTNLTRVTVSGFTVENAKYEGILVANASDVTILDNRVLNNDRALVITAGNGVCSGLPAFETGESDDCGEGLHLLGADHSLVAGNVVDGNAGGILLSDDTAAVRGNIIRNNLVSNNDFDCGITLASHPAANHAKTSFGVYLNTVLGNVSTNNGTKPPGGAGTGVFTSIPGAATYDNVIIYNTLTNNGQTGVAMHSHTPGQILVNNAIINNTISGNGADTGDAATAGPVGINLYAVSPASGTIISGNLISGESIDVAVNTGALVGVHVNQLLGTGTGVVNKGTGLVDATLNWWGCAGGPGTSGCSTVSAPGAGVGVVPVLGAP